jgi:Fe-S oxidoreductase
VHLETVTGVRYLYHDPCHSPIKQNDPIKVVNQLVNSKLNGSVLKNDRCCGESGTFAVTRPDIATQVRYRKEQELKRGVEDLRLNGSHGPVKILTSCPSCLQGLSRYEQDVPLEADYIVVEIAKHILGQDWLPRYVALANAGGIERVLV